MYDDHWIGLVIPAYNEAGHIGDVIDGVPAFVDRTYVVDDASTDGTWGEIQRHAVSRNESAEDSRASLEEEAVPVLADGGGVVGRPVVPIRHEENGGRGAAVKTGYRRALSDGMDTVAVIDGDGQMDATILERFLDPIVNGRADYVKGNRLLSSSHRAEMSRWRLFGNTLLTYLTKAASGYWQMMDPQNGYTAIAAPTLRSIDLDGLYEDYGFLNDLLVKLNVANARVVDVPMSAQYGDEQSGIRYSRFIPNLSSLLLRDFVWRLGTKYIVFDFHPLIGLYLLGGLGAAGGALSIAWTLGTGAAVGDALLTAGLFLAGGLFLTLGMLFERAHNLGLEGRVEDTVEERA